MESVEFINEMATYLLMIVSATGALSCLIQAIKMIGAEDEGDILRAKKSFKQVLKGTVVAISISGLIKAIFSIL